MHHFFLIHFLPEERHFNSSLIISPNVENLSLFVDGFAKLLNVVSITFYIEIGKSSRDFLFLDELLTDVNPDNGHPGDEVYTSSTVGIP